MQRKVPLPGKIFTWCIPRRRFAGLFGCMARISCQSQLILNTRRRYIATKGPFSRPRPFLGYTGAKYCHRQTPGNAITSTYRHRQAFGNAFRGHLAVAERPRAHCEHTLLCAGLRGIQFAGICRHARPPDDARRQHITSKATLRLHKEQHARSHRTPPEPIREMRRCPAAAVGTAAMKELGHRRAAYWGGGAGGALMRAAYLEHRRGIGARRPLGVAAH